MGSFKMFINNFLIYFKLGYFYKNNGILYINYGNKEEKLSVFIKNINFPFNLKFFFIFKIIVF